MEKNAFAIPFMTLLLVIAITLNIPIFRDIIVFVYLSFVPGFVILKAFKLKELGLLKIFLFSVGLSLFAIIFMGFLVNELYVLLGFSQPLSIIPLTIAVLTLTLFFFLISYRRDFSTINFGSIEPIFNRTKYHLPLLSVLLILPILGIVGGLYVNIPIIIILYLTIAVLCILSIASQRLFPTEAYPFIILSISISILLSNLLISKYTIGDDGNLEYYIFKLTQNKEYWGPINVFTNSGAAITYNSMLSVALLPDIYSVIMNVKNELIFKILYSFIFSLVPLTMYATYKKETGKIFGLFSVLFFMFGVNTFYGELIGVNRQIVGEFFLMLSIFLWLDKTIPIKEKRILVIIFGLSIAISHYSLAIIYLALISLIIIVSSIKPKFDELFNAPTFLAILGGTLFWFTFSSGSIMNLTITTAQNVVAELTNFQHGINSPGNRGVIYGLPQTFSASSWINLAVTGLVNLLLLIGVISVVLLSKRMRISDKYKFMTIIAAGIFAISYLFPVFAQTLNFTRFYAISFLFLSPCLAIGVVSLRSMLQSFLRKCNANRKNNFVFLNKGGKKALLLLAILISAYFLSQSGFINYVTDGPIHNPTIDYYRMKTSNYTQDKIVQFYTFIPIQDAVSADWLAKYVDSSSIVYSDSASAGHVLVSKGLVPYFLLRPLTNTTQPMQGSTIYLNSLNVAEGIVSSYNGSFNSSEISPILKGSQLIYTNGNSEIRGIPPLG